MPLLLTICSARGDPRKDHLTTGSADDPRFALRASANRLRLSQTRLQAFVRVQNVGRYLQALARHSQVPPHRLYFLPGFRLPPTTPSPTSSLLTTPSSFKLQNSLQDPNSSFSSDSGVRRPSPSAYSCFWRRVRLEDMRRGLDELREDSTTRGKYPTTRSKSLGTSDSCRARLRERVARVRT